MGSDALPEKNIPVFQHAAFLYGRALLGNSEATIYFLNSLEFIGWWSEIKDIVGLLGDWRSLSP
jgi:hypothetical protein